MDRVARAAVLALVSFAAGPVWSVPVEVSFSDLSSCDQLVVPPALDELGVGFPVDEAISASDDETGHSACPSADTEAPNVLVSITNLTTRSFPEVWYVSDPDTFLSNIDD